MTPGTDWRPTDDFLNRVKRAYRAALSSDGKPPPRSIWRAIGNRQSDVHEALLEEGNENLRRIFSDPGKTDLFYGVDNLCRTFLSIENIGVSCLADESKRLFDLAGLDRHPFTFPAPFAGEFGWDSGRGVVSYRAAQAAAQAVLLKRVNDRGNVLEIGPGLGRTALHARQLGIVDYTTVDLPMGMVAQACFLGATLGPDAIHFSTDDGDHTGRIRLLTFSSLRNSGQTYQTVINVDSLVEMDPISAFRYAFWIRRNAKTFISINQDYRRMKIGYLAAIFFRGARSERAPWPLRSGYDQIVYRF